MTNDTDSSTLRISIDVPADPNEMDPRVKAAVEELAAALQSQEGVGDDVEGFGMSTRPFTLEYVTGGSDGPGGGGIQTPYFQGLGFTVTLTQAR